MTKQTELQTSPISEGRKVKGVVLKKVPAGVFVDCDNGSFTGIILQKEVRDLARNGVDLAPGSEIEAEIINPDIRHEEGYYIVSISKLLQVDVWNKLLAKAGTDEVLTVVPTEANLGGLLVDMHGIKGFIPLSQLAPVHYPRVEDGDQEIIFEKLLDLIGQEFQVRIISVDEEEKRIILSEREALKEATEKILNEIEVGKTYKGVVSGLSSYGLFVTIGGSVEGLVHISEITYGHVNSIERMGQLGQEMEVKVIGLDNGKISLSRKQLKGDPWKMINDNFSVGDIIEGEVIRFVPYGVFVRMYDDINGLVHLSELSDKNLDNPSSAVKLGQIIKAKIILLDIRSRKIGLSMRALNETEEESMKRQRRTAAPKRRYYKKKDAEGETTPATPAAAPATEAKAEATEEKAE